MFLYVYIRDAISIRWKRLVTARFSDGSSDNETV